MTPKRVDLSLPQFGFVVATRAALGAGIGLLAAGRLCRRSRERLGAALLTVGALTTIPAAFLLFGRGTRSRSRPASPTSRDSGPDRESVYDGVEP